ncbi:hypothetical protein BJV78DRAFT_29638 [Lactifluus subvellereus]|nr:hypothetical protein BJV78DRAFT_29638 [Lactifluus subvellereus]
MPSTHPPRVYTAIMSQPELSFAIPELDLHWFGVKESYAFIASAAPEQPVSINAVPLFIDAAAAERSTTVSLDLAEHGLLAEHQCFVVYNPLTNDVLDSDNWGTHQLPLSIGRSGGSCVVSPVYTLSSNKSLHIHKAPWRIAHVTPHTLATEPERDAASVAGTETEASKLDYDSESEFLNQEIKPPPLKPRIVATVNPRRTLEFIVPLLWRTLGYLVRALIMRLFAMVGLPVSPLLSYLRPAHPKEDHIMTQVRAIGYGSRAGSTVVAEPEHAVSERSEVPGEVVSDSATEVASSTGGERRSSSRVFNIPKGPFSLLAHTNLAINGDEETRSLYPEAELDGERMDLKITPLGHGWAVMHAKEDVHGGRVEIYGTATSIWNGSLP